MIISFKIFLIENLKFLREISCLYLYSLKCKVEQKCVMQNASGTRYYITNGNHSHFDSVRVQGHPLDE